MRADRDRRAVLRRRTDPVAARRSARCCAGFMPRPEIVTNPAMLYIAIGILGATVMPHNLYLHSADRPDPRVRPRRRRASARRSSTRRSTARVALMLALFVNAAILILAAAAFHVDRADRRGRDPGRLSAACADAGRGRGEHAVRGGAARLGAELDGHRDAGGAGGDGGVPPPPAPAVAAAADHARLAIVPAVIVAAIYGESGTAQAAGAEPGRAVASSCRSR